MLTSAPRQNLLISVTKSAKRSNYPRSMIRRQPKFTCIPYKRREIMYLLDSRCLAQNCRQVALKIRPLEPRIQHVIRTQNMTHDCSKRSDKNHVDETAKILAVYSVNNQSYKDQETRIQSRKQNLATMRSTQHHIHQPQQSKHEYKNPGPELQFNNLLG